MSDNTLNIYQRAQILARELRRLRTSTGIVIVEPRATAVAEGVLAEDPLDEGLPTGTTQPDLLNSPPTIKAADGKTTLHRFQVEAVMYRPTLADARSSLQEGAGLYGLDAARVFVESDATPLTLDASDAGLVADILEEDIVHACEGDRHPNIVDRLERIIALLRRQAETDPPIPHNPGSRPQHIGTGPLQDDPQDSRTSGHHTRSNTCGHFLGVPIPSDASLQLNIHPETVEQFNATIRQALEAGLPAVAKQGDTTEWAELGIQKRQVILFVPRNGSAREQIRLVVGEKIDATGFVDVHPADLLSTDASDEEVRAAVRRLDSKINDEQAFDATRRELRADPAPQTAHEMMDRINSVMDPEQSDGGSVMEASEKLVDAADQMDAERHADDLHHYRDFMEEGPS